MFAISLKDICSAFCITIASAFWLIYFIFSAVLRILRRDAIYSGGCVPDTTASHPRRQQYL
jgi:hypothetical protein